MYKITEENLYWAYKKLKNYIFYYNSSNYLKDKIIEFENNYTNQTFVEMRNRLNELASFDYNMLSHEGVTYCIYPKKDGIEIENGDIKVTKYNFFIDMPIEFYLVDILFTLDLFENIDRDRLKFAYGNAFDDRLYDIAASNNEYEDILKNKLLFAKYSTKYSEWKTSAYNALENNKDIDKVVFKLDLQRCFYNIYFNINDLIRDIFGMNYREDSVTKIVCNIYRYFTKILNEELVDNFKRKSGYVHLPIGLFSSYVILNYLLSPLDYYFASNALGYARYVDDVLIVEEKNSAISDKGKERFVKYYSDILVKDGDTYTIDSSVLKCGKLIVNSNKLKTSVFKKGFSIKKTSKHFKSFFKPSFYDPDEVDEDNNEVDIASSNGFDFLRSKVYSLEDLNLNQDMDYDFISKINNADIINIFPLWKNIIVYCRKYNSELEIEFKNTVIESINSISSIDISVKNIKSLNVLKNTLTKEYEVSEKLAIDDLNNCFRKRRTKETFEYIASCENGTINDVFYPTNISFDEISSYCSFVYSVDSCFYNTCCEIYYKANNFYPKSAIKYEINDEDDGIIKINRIDDFEDCNIENPDTKTPIYIAVANINMPESNFEMADINNQFCGSLNIKEYKRIMRNAKHSGAETILFPELCLPIDYLSEIIKYAKRIGISIITGVSHLFIDKRAINLTLIVDCKINLAILKEKNYIPYIEQTTCAKYGYVCDGQENPYYYVINNGTFTYSTMTCFEATCINDRAKLSDKIEILFMPVYNRDTEYFSSIISSFARDASCFVAVANNNEFGDSRITGPYGHVGLNIVKLKGGINNYFVIGEIELNDYDIKYEKHMCLITGIENRLEEVIDDNELDKTLEDFKKIKLKPLSAGVNRNLNRDKNRIKKS